MEITLYNFSKRKNSTKRPSGGASVEVTLKQNTSIYSPTFMLKHDNAEAYNYLKWDNRYYYINDVVRTNIKDVKEIYCTIDSLATFKTDIGNTDAYITYSASEHDPYIPDNRLSMDESAVITSASDTAFSYSNDGTYILTVVSDNASENAIARYWVDKSNMQAVSSSLVGLFDREESEISIANLVSELQRQLSAVRDAFVECRYLPVHLITRDMSTRQIHLGSYATTGYGVPLTGDQVASGVITLTIPWQFNDYRNTSAYTSMYLYLPAYGYYVLNADDFVGKSTLIIRTYWDMTNGDITYMIGNVAKCTTNIARNVPIGNITSGALQSIMQVGSTTVSAYSGNLLGASVGLFNAFKSALHHDVGVVGSTGGLGTVLSHPAGNYGQATLYVFTHSTNIDPEEINAVQGRPLNAVRTIGDLSGYVETVNASVITNAPDFIKDEINSYLNGGIYYE